jgi:hypothetical protein
MSSSPGRRRTKAGSRFSTAKALKCQVATDRSTGQSSATPRRRLSADSEPVVRAAKEEGFERVRKTAAATRTNPAASEAGPAFVLRADSGPAACGGGPSGLLTA